MKRGKEEIIFIGQFVKVFVEPIPLILLCVVEIALYTRQVGGTVIIVVIRTTIA